MPIFSAIGDYASSPTVRFSGGLPREPADETENVFERKKALKWCVANRPPASIVGTLLTFTAFAELLEKNLRQPTKLTVKAGLNKTCAEEQNKRLFKFYNFSREKS